MKRTQTRAEEWANTVIHGLGLIGAVVALPVLIVTGVRSGGASAVVGGTVFAASAIILYLASTVYHALPHGRWKHRLRVLDHVAIYVLIAGSYTPFALGVLRGPWGWSLLGTVWTLALVGVWLKTRRPVQAHLWLYLLMGWLVVVAIKPLWGAMPGWGLFWLAAGGFAYTAGTVFFSLDRVRFFHAVWHVFVVAGTTCHFVAVLHFAGA